MAAYFRSLEHGTPMTRSFAQNRLLLHAARLVMALSAAGAATLAQAQAVAPPEFQAAQQAVERANQADADQYAPGPLADARQALVQAQIALDKRDRRGAQELALRSAAVADLARARSLEAVLTAELRARQDEVRRLRRELDAEGEQ